MDRVVDAMHQAGIKVIMGTPTYSIPPAFGVGKLCRHNFHKS
jgi:hypothetical protein